MRPLTDFLCPETQPGNLPSGALAREHVERAMEEARRKGIDPLQVPCVVDHLGSKGAWNAAYSPCITAARASSGGHWITSKQRQMSWKEMARLQGADPERVAAWQGAILASRFGRIVGNAVPVPLLSRLFLQVLPAAGLVRESAMSVEPLVARSAGRGCAAASAPQPSQLE